MRGRKQRARGPAVQHPRDAERGSGDFNTGDYRGDFGPEGHFRFGGPSHKDYRSSPRAGHSHEHNRYAQSDAEHDPQHGGSAGPWEWRHSHREGWQRGRREGGYGSQYAAWKAGAGFGPEASREEPGRGGFEDEDWQVTRPARGRGAWAADWENAPDHGRRHSQENYQQENYRGRGPKDYRRSDERIREEVCERLTDDWAVDASEITVSVDGGEVLLSGSVPSREQKRRAEECVEHVSGVRDVLNHLRVGRRELQAETNAPAGSTRAQPGGAVQPPGVAADKSGER